MNNLYIRVSDALTVAATCDGYLLAYKTLDYSNVALEEVYATFGCIEFDNAFVVFDGRPSLEQYDGAIHAFCFEVAKRKVYGNVNADDVAILYRLLKGMGIQNVQMFDYSAAMLLTAGESVYLYRSYEKYLIFPVGDGLFHYAEAGDSVFRYARENGLVVFDDVDAAIADLFKENFLTEKQRKKLTCFAVALAYCQPYQIKPSVGEVSPPEKDQVEQETGEEEQGTEQIAQEEVFSQQEDEKVEEQARQMESSTAKLTVSRPARFKRISADKVDLLNLPEYCKIEIDFDLIRRQAQQRKEGCPVEKSKPIVIVDLDKYDKILRTEGDVLQLYPAPGSAFGNLENAVKKETVAEEPLQPEKGDNMVAAGEQFNPLSLLDTSFLSEEDSTAEAVNTTEGKTVNTKEGENLIVDVHPIEKPKSAANDNFARFMETIRRDGSGGGGAGTDGVTAENIAQTERNAKLRSLNYAVDGGKVAKQDLQLFDDTATSLADEEFDPAQASEFNINVAAVRKGKGSFVGFAVLGVLDFVLLVLLILSFFSGKFLRTVYTDEEQHILTSCKAMAEFRGYVDALMADGNSGVAEEIKKVGKAVQIISMNVYSNDMHDNYYIVLIPEWTTPEKVISDIRMDYPYAAISGMSSQRLCSVVISRQKGAEQ